MSFKLTEEEGEHEWEFGVMLEQPHAERWELRLRGETTNDKGNNDDVIVMTEENMACE